MGNSVHDKCKAHTEVVDHKRRALYDEKVAAHGQRFAAFVLPPRSMVGQLTLDQHIGVRIPGGQPNDTKGLIDELWFAEQLIFLE
jgi:hypothetical protein